MVAVQDPRPKLPGDMVGLVRVAHEAVQLLDEHDDLLVELSALLGMVERLTDRWAAAGARDWRLDHLRHDLKAALNDVDTVRGKTANKLVLLGARR